MTHKTHAFPVWELVGSAWQKVKGSKKTFWAAFIVSTLILVIGGILAQQSKSFSHSLSHTLNFLLRILGFLLQMSLIYMGIMRAKNSPINVSQVFYSFNLKLILRMIVAYLLQLLLLLPAFILMLIGFALQKTGWDNVHPISSILGIFLIIAGLVMLFFIAMRLALVFPYILDGQLKPTTAIKLSYRATHGNVFKLFAAFLLQTLILILAAIPLGIGLIWALPFVFIFYGLIYAHLSNALATDMKLGNLKS
jgi:uncharacterized membrane protein